MDPTVFTPSTIDEVANKFTEYLCKSATRAYSFTKVLENAYTRLLAQRLANWPEGSMVYVNCVNPGMVDTDMYAKLLTSIGDETFAELLKQKVLEAMIRPISSGAATPVWLALHPARGPSERS